MNPTDRKNNMNHWKFTPEERERLINRLTKELPTFRGAAKATQNELANAVGISRQTYNAVEIQKRKMTWNTYMSLILFFDYNPNTHYKIRQLGVFPQEFDFCFNEGLGYSEFEQNLVFGNKTKDIIETLDEQAKRTIRALVMLEYARCKNKINDEVIGVKTGG